MNEKQQDKENAAEGTTIIPADTSEENGASSTPDSPDITSVSETGETSETLASQAQEANGEPAPDDEELSTGQSDDEDSQFHVHFDPIPEEKITRAKRTRRVLIVVIILLFVVLLGTGIAVAYYYVNFTQPSATVEHASSEIDRNDSTTQDRGATETIEMPNLVQMFGKTPEEIVSTLGSDYSITKTGSMSEESTAEGEADEGSTDASEGTSSAAIQVTTASYTPKEQTSLHGATQVQNIYLGLDASGKTIEVYFVSSMNLLDYPISSFADLVATKTAFSDTLTSAGATVPSNISYTVPTEEEYTEYVDPNANNKKIKKESFSFMGSLSSENPPTSFEITYTYDYGANGVEISPDRQPTQRMLYIKLS